MQAAIRPAIATGLLLPIATLLLLTLIAGCVRDDLPVAPKFPSSRGDIVMRTTTSNPRDADIGVQRIRVRLERAADGLLYTSESDYPFSWVSAPGPVVGPLTEAGFRVAFAIPDSVPVETITLDAFFARHIERVDPGDAAAVALVPRYRRLRETIRRTVPDAGDFRAGTIAIDCFVVGIGGRGDVIGLATVAIET